MVEVNVNRLAIAIQLNDRRVIIGAQWPTMRSLKATARLRMARLKRKAREDALSMVLALIPLPSVVAA